MCCLSKAPRSMSETKTLTLRELRELARKHLGRGHSRLKTKDELLDALRRASGGPASSARGAEPQGSAPVRGGPRRAARELPRRDRGAPRARPDERLLLLGLHPRDRAHSARGGARALARLRRWAPGAR